MSFEDEQRVRVLSGGFRSAIEVAISFLAFGGVIPAYGNVEAPNSAAYQEVTVPLDPETKAVGGALYAQHCAACHDGDMFRAPQCYVLENVSRRTPISMTPINLPPTAVGDRASKTGRQVC